MIRMDYRYCIYRLPTSVLRRLQPNLCKRAQISGPIVSRLESVQADSCELTCDGGIKTPLIIQRTERTRPGILFWEAENLNI